MKRILTAMLILASALVFAQDRTAQPVRTESRALKDAEYALRPFEEATARIDWNRLKAPGTAIGDSHETFLKTFRLKYIDDVKALLKRFDRNKPTATELLDLMYDLDGAAQNLHYLSDLVGNFQDPEESTADGGEMNALSVELNRDSNTLSQASAEVFNVVRNKIGNEEGQSGTPPKKNMQNQTKHF